MSVHWSKAARRALRAAQSTTVRRIVLACAGGALVATTIARRSDIATALESVGTTGVLFALAVVTASVIAQWMAWHTCIVGLGRRSAPMSTLSIFLASLPGKYLPGGVWTTMLQVEHGTRIAIERSRMLAASLLSMVITLLVGATIGTALLLGDITNVPYGWLAIAIVAPGAALLMPPVQRRLAGWIRRVTKREGEAVSLPLGSTAVALVWTSISWVLLGLHIVVLSGGELSLRRATAAFAISWTIGFLFVVAPAGAGVRDVALAAAIGAALGDGGGVAVSLLSRAVVTLVDLALAGGAVALAWRYGSRRRSRTETLESS